MEGHKPGCPEEHSKPYEGIQRELKSLAPAIRDKRLRRSLK